MSNEIQQSILNKARADKFIMVFTLPEALRDLNQSILTTRAQEYIKQDSLQYSVWGIVVPNVSVPAETTSIWGQPYKVTSQARSPYPPIALNFTIDNGYNNYWILWKWLELLNKPRQSGVDEKIADTIAEDKGTYLDYQTVMTIFGLDEYNNKVIQFDYFNSFITDLGEIRYNYRDPTELESSFQFEFSQMSISLLDDNKPIDPATTIKTAS